MKLSKILKGLLLEIGEEQGSLKPYDYGIEMDSEKSRVYYFETNPDDDTNSYYTVKLTEQDTDYLEKVYGKNNMILYGDDKNKDIPDNQKRVLDDTVLEINFGVIDPETDKPDANIITNKGDLYKVMNTVVAIVKEDIQNHDDIKYIAFNATARKGKDKKSSNIRANLYTKYILNRMPNAEIIENNIYDVLAKIK